MKNRILVCAVTVTVTGLALAGCGGSSAPSLSAFKSGFSADKTEFRQLGAKLGRELTGANGKTDKQVAAEFAVLATAAKQQASKLSKLDPPSKYKHSLSDLVSGFSSVASDLTSISAAAVKHDSAAAKTATQTLIADASKVKTADASISTGLGLPTSG